ncbi:hypothetical protein Dimus_020971 [Dionaea muscipula]
MPTSEKELEEKLMEFGNRLCSLPSSIDVDELLPLLDQIEICLSRVNQSPPESLQKGLAPSIKALVADELLRHADIDVRVAVAACISEITRITAPEVPYDDGQMKDVFQLIVSSFERLYDKFSRSFNKRVTILETVSKVRLCVVMLDLECDELILVMFHHFLESIRNNHHENVFLSMETIMTLILEESEEISPELITSILSCLERDKDVLPVAQKLGEKVVENICQGKSGDELNITSIASKNSASDLSDGDLVGLRISVWWPADQDVTLLFGNVLGAMPIVNGILPMLSAVTYDDGDAERLVLKDEIWKMADDKLVSLKAHVSDGESPDASSEMFYEGVDDEFDSVEKKHKVTYDDGDVEIMVLKDEKWEMVDDKLASVNKMMQEAERICKEKMELGLGSKQIPDCSEPEQSAEMDTQVIPDSPVHHDLEAEVETGWAGASEEENVCQFSEGNPNNNRLPRQQVELFANNWKPNVDYKLKPREWKNQL